MQKLLVSLVTLFVVTTNAAELPEGTTEVRPIAVKRYSTQSEITKQCPDGAACDPAATVYLTFELSGCVNNLGPVSTRVEYNSDRTWSIYVSAVELVNELSTRTDCIKIPEVQWPVVLGMGFITDKDVKVYDLNARGK